MLKYTSFTVLIIPILALVLYIILVKWNSLKIYKQ